MRRPRPRPLLLLVLTTGALAAAAPAGAAPTWLAPAAISAPGVSSYGGDVAIDGDGDVVAVWSRGSTLETRFRPAGGEWGDPVPVATSAQFATASVAFDPLGSVTVVWNETEGASRQAFAAVRPDGETFGQPQPLSAPGSVTADPRVVIDPAGNALAAWRENGGLGTAYRPAGGSFGAPVTLGVAGSGNNGYDVALDAGGNAVIVGARYDATPGATSYVEAASRPFGGAFTAMTTVASAVDGAALPSVAFDPAGNALATYMLWDTTVVESAIYRWRVSMATRPKGGVFGASQPLATTTRFSYGPDVAFDAAGNAIAVWEQGFQPQAAVRQAGGAFGAAQRLSPAAHDILNGPVVAIDQQGTARVVWVGTDGSGYAARSVSRPSGGTFSAMQTLSGNGVNVAKVRLGLDDQGNAAAFWRRSNGTNELAEVAGLDAAPPQLRGLTIPPSGLTGGALAFGVTPVDVWSAVTGVGWDFGDAATAPGPSVSHAYAAPGAFTATVTATDALGNAASASGPVAVTTAPGAPGGPSSLRDVTAPVLSAVTLTPARFRAASRGAPLTSRGGGATLRFRLTEAARVRVTVERASVGRRVGSSCRKPTSSNRRRPRCTRYVQQPGSASREARAGASRLRFLGRLGGRKLGAGRYRLVLGATDAAGNRASARRAPFLIRPPR